MKTSTQTRYPSSVFGLEKAIEYIAKAGYDAWDISLSEICDYDWTNHVAKFADHPLCSSNYLAYARKLKQIGLDNGIVCNQSHAPFPSHGKGMMDLFKRSIECTAEVGGSICVIHPDCNKDVEGNAEMYNELLPFAREHGVKIATENMWDWDREKDEAFPTACSTHENFKAQLDALNDDYFVACVDIGHAEMKGLNTSAAEMIRTLGSKVQALHIHDNDRWHDDHQIPFSMNIDFEAVVKALKEVNYDGFFTLEADAYLKGRPEEDIFEEMKNMANAARRLADMFEA